MKLLKTKLFAIVALLLWAGIAHGVCNLTGYPVRVTSIEGKTILYFRTTHTANYYYVGFSSDPLVAATINKSYTGKAKVFVQSNLAVCPAPVVPGRNHIGKITRIVLGV